MPSTPRWRNAAAKAHILALAAEHGVEVTWVNGWRMAEAWPPSLAVSIPVVRRPHDYLVALHEMGHVLSPHARAVPDDTDAYGEICCEGAAWAWAAAHADPALAALIPAEEWAWTMGRTFGSYLQVTATYAGPVQRYLPDQEPAA